MNDEIKKEAEALNTKISALKKGIEAGATKEELTNALNEIKEANKGLVSKEELTRLDGIIKTMGEELETIKENAQTNNVKLDLVKELKENKDNLVKIAKGGAGEVEMKALVTRASVVDSPAGFMLPDIGQLGVKERSLYNILPKVSLGDGNHAGTVRYRDWDEATIVRAAAMVAEGAAFPESTAAFRWYNIDLKKIGDTLPVTEEFFEDEAQAAGELEMFLDVNVNTKIDEQIVNGDNVGQNLKGFLNSVPAYTAVASGISSPNLKDLAIKVKNSITRTRGSKYKPDTLVVSSSTMEDLVLAKDANNNYIFDENTGTLGGLFVVIDENMPDNQIIVGDRRYARIYEKGGVVLSKGYVNGQFTEDEMTLKARKRLLFLIRNVDQTGFAKVTDVDAALATLATP
ncbi:major capsid protein [Tenacibaculum phage JQ]|nr:major capsid protein [Tenacibaculum phage JQ]